MSQSESESVDSSAAMQKQDGGARKNHEVAPSRSRSRTRRGPDSGDGPIIRSRSHSEEPSWYCDKCVTVFSNKSDKLLSCEYCSNHRCLKCLGITKTVYNAINGRDDLPWFCHVCMEKSLNVLRETKSIEDRCSDFLKGFEKKIDDRMSRIEKEMHDVKEGMGSMKDDILKQIQESAQKESVMEIRPGGSVSQPDSGSETVILSSIQERMDRKNNVVFYNVVEGVGNLKDELKRHDIEQIKMVAEEVGVTLQNEDIVSAKRLGLNKVTKKDKNGVEVSVPRVIQASFTEQAKASIMKNVYKLGQSKSEYLKKVSVKHDMNKDERIKDAKLRKEAKALNEKEGDANFRFVVRGQAWDRKLTRVKVHTGGRANRPPDREED